MRRIGGAALVLVLVMGGCTAKPMESDCATKVVTDALPTWARSGFSFDGAGVPHVFSERGDILGVLFGFPLSAPPAANHSNKILWVSRVPLTMGDDLKISAKLDGTGEAAELKVGGGPGPSIIDLPKPGCWRLSLQWSGHADSMDLTYSS